MEPININLKEFDDSMGKYKTYCMNLQKSYDIKHGEVEEYARLIREIKKDVDALLTESWEKSDANRKYLLEIIQLNLHSLKKVISKKNMKRLKKLIDAQKNKIKETTELMEKINGKLSGLDGRLGKITPDFQKSTFVGGSNHSSGGDGAGAEAASEEAEVEVEAAGAAAAEGEEAAAEGAAEAAAEAATEAAAGEAEEGNFGNASEAASAEEANSEFMMNAPEEEENTSNNNEVEDVEDVEKFKKFIEKEKLAYEERQENRDGSLKKDMPEHGRQLTEYISYCDKLQYYYYIKHGEVLELVEIIKEIQKALKDINLENNKKDNEDNEDIEFLIRIIRNSSPRTDISIALHGALNTKRKHQEKLMRDSRSISKTLIETLNRIKSGAPPTPPTQIIGIENPMYYPPQNYNPTQGSNFSSSLGEYDNAMGYTPSNPRPENLGYGGRQSGSHFSHTRPTGGYPGLYGHGNLSFPGSGGTTRPRVLINKGYQSISPRMMEGDILKPTPTYAIQEPNMVFNRSTRMKKEGAMMNPTYVSQQPSDVPNRKINYAPDQNNLYGTTKAFTSRGDKLATRERHAIDNFAAEEAAVVEAAAAAEGAKGAQQPPSYDSAASGGEFYGALGAAAPGSINSSGYVKVSPASSPKANNFGNYPQTPEAIDPNKGPENNKMRRNQKNENKKARQIKSSVNSSKGGAKQTRKLGILTNCCNKGSKKNQFLGKIKPDKGKKITFKANKNNKSKKKRGGPSNIKATYYNPQNKKTKGGPRMLKATGGARKNKKNKNKKTKKRRL